MNPIRNIQDELHQRNKELGFLKDENMRLQQEVAVIDECRTSSCLNIKNQ